MQSASHHQLIQCIHKKTWILHSKTINTRSFSWTLNGAIHRLWVPFTGCYHRLLSQHTQHPATTSKDCKHTNFRTVKRHKSSAAKQNNKQTSCHSLMLSLQEQSTGTCLHGNCTPFSKREIYIFTPPSERTKKREGKINDAAAQND